MLISNTKNQLISMDLFKEKDPNQEHPSIENLERINKNNLLQHESFKLCDLLKLKEEKFKYYLSFNL